MLCISIPCVRILYLWGQGLQWAMQKSLTMEAGNKFLSAALRNTRRSLLSTFNLYSDKTALIRNVTKKQQWCLQPSVPAGTCSTTMTMSFFGKVSRLMQLVPRHLWLWYTELPMFLTNSNIHVWPHSIVKCCIGLFCVTWVYQISWSCQIKGFLRELLQRNPI